MVRLHSACTMARSVTNPKEFTITNFPKRDEVQKRRRHWQAQKHRIPRLRRPSMQRVQNSLSASTFSHGQPLSWDLDGNSLLQNRASSDTSKVEMDPNSISKTVPRCFFLVRRRQPGIHTSEWRVHWPLPRSGDGSGTSERCGSCPEGAGQVQADACRSSIHRSRRGRRGADGVPIADCGRT